MSSIWRYELRLMLRQRVVWLALLVMVLLSTASVIAGFLEVQRQHAVIERIQPLQAEDEAALARSISVDGDAGNTAYYTFHATWDAPSELAFAALGQRDVAPYLLRVRALALEGQLYEGENYNAELALPGRFDWAFVLTYIAPLLVIVLLHDLLSGEREAGRMTLLAAMARQERQLWIRRITLRLVMLLCALALPFVFGALLSRADLAGIVLFLAVAGAYLLFWAVLCWWINCTSWSSLANAATLAAVWLVLTLVLPALTHLAINIAIPVRQGVELTLAQREQVHAGWDAPVEQTMQAFFSEHPEWRDTPPITGGFHWKWYYAFQHLGDVSAAASSRAYREALRARNRWTNHAGILLPAVAVQAIVHRMARTDLLAGLDYMERIRAFHERLRRFYYPYIFNETPFREADFLGAPRWSENFGSGSPRPVVSPHR